MSAVKRRSTRVSHNARVIVSWTDGSGQSVSEEGTTASVSCHGFQYFSRQLPRKNLSVTLQVAGKEGHNRAGARVYPGRVAWVRKSKRLDGIRLVGIELAIPLNIWELDDVPEDWIRFSPRSDEIPDQFLAEMERILQPAVSVNYYDLLGVRPDATKAEMKRRFHQLALRFHPDRHMDHPDWTARLAAIMESLTHAYRTLTDDHAKKEYDAALASRERGERPDSRRAAEGHIEKARECMAEKNYAGSILWLHRAIECEPNSSNHRTLLARCLSAIPEYRREAVEQFQKAIELDPRNIAAHLQYGELLETLKAPTRAREHYLRVLEIDASHRGARERLTRLGMGAPRAASRPSLLSRLTRRP